ncbi:MAG: sugar transferase [Clostridia bacterium]|nr:sugar transferase [Clostridia bacterium]
MRVYSRCIKRLLDFVLSLAALILLSPLMLVLCVLVRIKLGAPVIFSQPRAGKDEKIFVLRKFRTMTDARDEDGNLLPDEERLTSFGKMLRATSLDELPELINILRGDMSIVGPRPLLVEYLPLYNEQQRHRHDVRPGLTGLAQVSGRNAISWEERFELDCEYVHDVTFRRDVSIIFKTVRSVLAHEGISAEGEATMQRFTGTPEKAEDVLAASEDGALLTGGRAS